MIRLLEAVAALLALGALIALFLWGLLDAVLAVCEARRDGVRDWVRDV
jgi:hypothetical protein